VLRRKIGIRIKTILDALGVRNEIGNEIAPKPKFTLKHC